jgi:hypothetical protein
MKACQRVIFLVARSTSLMNSSNGFICLPEGSLRFELDNDYSIPSQRPEVDGEITSGSVPEHRNVPESFLGDVGGIACKFDEVSRSRTESYKLFSGRLHRQEAIGSPWRKCIVSGEADTGWITE